VLEGYTLEATTVNSNNGKTRDLESVTAVNDQDISLSITFLEYSNAYERALSMASYTHFELERPLQLPRTCESVPADK
jgi:hypothetical protein